MSQDAPLILLAAFAAVMMLGGFVELWQRRDREWKLRIGTMELRHEAERTALGAYSDIVQKWIDGEATKEDADAAYHHYMNVCFPDD